MHCESFHSLPSPYHSPRRRGPRFHSKTDLRHECNVFGNFPDTLLPLGVSHLPTAALLARKPPLDFSTIFVLVFSRSSGPPKRSYVRG